MAFDALPATASEVGMVVRDTSPRNFILFYVLNFHDRVYLCSQRDQLVLTAHTLLVSPPPLASCSWLAAHTLL